MGFLVDDGGSVFYAVAHFASEFAADKGGDAMNQLRIELIGFSLALFGKAALPLCVFGTVLLSLDAVPLDFAADGAFVAVELFGDSVMESCISNANPPSSEKFSDDFLLYISFLPNPQPVFFRF